jgi:peptide alpha-N-acetyltransferase
LKHAGDLNAAAAFADEARRMDLADRYVNSECVKRMLQADQVSVFNCTIFIYQLTSLLIQMIIFFSFSDSGVFICSVAIKVALAEKIAVLFTKDGDQHNNLHDMQCMWLVYNHVLILCNAHSICGLIS